ncbi:protein translocase subunit SecF, partial [Candidatus Aerophobetes bacterium]
MRFFGETKIDFIALRKKAFIISGIMIAATLFLIISRGGLKLGLDFTGGIEVRLKFSQSPSIARIRGALAKIGLSEAVIQQYGRKEENLILIKYKVEEVSQDIASKIIAYRTTQGKLTSLEELKNITGIEIVGYENLANLLTLDPSQEERIDINQATEDSLVSLIRRITHRKIVAKIEGAVKEEFREERNAFLVESTDLIGPQVSKELQKNAILAVIFALVGMLAYIAWRFELRFAVGAVVALVHDVFISVGALALGGYEFTLPIIAALLTIIGYSLNDTIVVYDRIRENSKVYRKERTSLKKVLNLGINQSLSRTIITSLTTFLVVLILFLWGGAVIH